VYSDTAGNNPDLTKSCIEKGGVFVPESFSQLITGLKILANTLNDSHSFSKIKANLAKVPSGSTKTLCVLVSTGAYCPVHKMHIENFNVAKTFLEEKHNFNVIGGLISPSHDVYITSKLGAKAAISSFHRIQMCDLAAHDSDWIEADSWEATRPGFVSFKNVTQHVDAFLKLTFPTTPIQVIFLCGADLVVRCHMTNLGKYWVIATGRHGYSEQVAQLLQATPESHRKLYWLETLMDDISSTKIRNAIATNQPIGDLTYENVVQYLKKYLFAK
jgi:nicotinamide mononucleotide adenylyltransferase